MTSDDIHPNKEKSKESKRQSRKARWEQGAKDPVLLKDITEIEISFRAADAETAKRLDE